MDNYVIAAPPQAEVPVKGGGMFPVRRIYCVGRNYAAHAREMGFSPEREDPFFFMKPADAVVLDGTPIPYPRMTSNLHHEVELVLAIGRRGRELPAARASGIVFGYAVGLDLTRRDVQIAHREKGQPWDMGKGFDRSAPCGTIVPASQVPDITSAGIKLAVNGEVRQSGDISDMIWSIDEILHWLSKYVDLAPGDLIYTGTPEGVSALNYGDELVASVDGLPELRISIARNSGSRK